MGAVRIECPMCGASMKVGEGRVGKRGRCPKCGEEFLAPAGRAIPEKQPDVDFDLSVPKVMAEPAASISFAPEPPASVSASDRTVLLPARPLKRKRPRWLVPAIGLLGLAGITIVAVGILALVDNGEATGPTAEDDSREPAVNVEPEPEPVIAQPAAPPVPQTVGELTVNDLNVIKMGVAARVVTTVTGYLGQENTGDYSDEMWETETVGDTGLLYTATGRVEYTAQNRASPTRYKFSVTVLYDVPTQRFTVEAAKVGTKVIH